MTSKAMFEAKLLADHIRSLGEGDDEQLMIDMIEGETDAMGTVDRILEAIGMAEQHQAVLKLREDEMASRRQRYDARARSLRGSLAAWMSDCGLKKIERPEATLSLGEGKASVIYSEGFGADLPDEYVKVSRSPDKAAVRAAVLAGKSVIGATLSNAQPVLTIRRS